jgi:hypothetical protein
MTTRRPATRGRHRVITLLSVVVSVLIGLVALSYGLHGPIRDMIVNLTSLMLAVAAVLAALHACRRASGHTRRGWVAMAVACGAWAISQALWTLTTNVLGLDLPYPSPLELGSSRSRSPR